MNGNDKVGVKQLPISKGDKDVSMSFDDLLGCGFDLSRRGCSGRSGRHFARGNDFLPLYQRVSKKLFVLQSSHVLSPERVGPQNNGPKAQLVLYNARKNLAVQTFGRIGICIRKMAIAIA